MGNETLNDFESKKYIFHSNDSFTTTVDRAELILQKNLKIISEKDMCIGNISSNLFLLLILTGIWIFSKFIDNLDWKNVFYGIIIFLIARIVLSILIASRQKETDVHEILRQMKGVSRGL